MKTSYYWNGNSLSGVQTGSDVLYFYYGSDQKLEGFSLNGTNYLYLRDAIGTINGILDADGALVAQYLYDAWGNILSVLDGAGVDVSSNTAHIANVNPFRYRGYFYDADTGFYYLQSRYYDPVVGRFLNADDAGILGLVSAMGQAQGSLLGGNLYAYCANNPVMFVDQTGYGPVGAVIGAILGFGLGAILTPYIADLIGLKGWKRTAFIWGGTAVITALGAWAGYYIGEAIFKIYKAAGRFALKVNEAIARGLAKLVGGSIKSASGNGWIIKVGKLTLRVMTEGGGRVNYFRLSHATKGAMTLLGSFSGDRALTHIKITIASIVQLVATILKYK